MMKVLSCRDAGIDCDFVARGETDEELLRLGTEHLKTAHNIDLEKFSSEEIEKIKTLVREE